jgi:RHS repeat-associated protein
LSSIFFAAKNGLISVSSASTANFYYDADGKQVKTVVNGVTTYYVGNHYEVKNSVVTKYYFAGATRLAVRTGGTLSYLLGDHIGSSSVTTDANGVKTASALYKAFGETRFSSGNLGTDYKFTGQREEASLGIYYFNARWIDPSLGRFTSPDTIVPTSTQGTQAWDRYGFVNNNPVRYNDPTGHMMWEGDGGCTTETDCNPTSEADILASVIATGNRAKEKGGVDREHNPDLIYYRQLAIQMAIQIYNIQLNYTNVNLGAYADGMDADTRPGNNLGYNPWGEDPGEAVYKGSMSNINISLGEDVFRSPGYLGSVIGHENYHVYQYSQGNFPVDGATRAKNEVAAFNYQLDNRSRFGLTDSEVASIQDQAHTAMETWLGYLPVTTH